MPVRRGLRHDRGEPPDGLEPAPARRPQARLGRRAERRRDPASPTASGRTLPPGSAGEVVIRGPGVTAGLPRQPRGERRRRSSTAGSGRATAARFDADGYLRLEGRLKEMILRGGENISPLRDRGGPARAPRRRRRDLLRDRRREVRRARRRGRGAPRRRRRARADRPLPRAARRRSRCRRWSTCSTRSRARRPARCSASGSGPRSRRAPGEVRDPRRRRDRRLRRRRARPRRRDVTLIARGPHLRALQERRRAGAEPARRLRGASRGDRRHRRDRRRRRRLRRRSRRTACPALAPRLGAALRPGAAVIAGAERPPLVVLPVARRPARRHRRSSRSTRAARIAARSPRRR